jgi:hypothetical protein
LKNFSFGGLNEMSDETNETKATSKGKAQSAPDVEAIAQRVAEIMRTSASSQPDGSFRVVEHTQVMCDQTGKTFDARHENPYAACKADGVKNPTFSGAGTVQRVVSGRPSGNHALYSPELHGELEEVEA